MTELGRIRRPGGGRKISEQEADPLTLEKFETIIADHQAGDPMNSSVKFTYLSRPELLSKMSSLGVNTSLYHINKLLSKLGLGRRKMSKVGTYKQIEGRNEQFEYISELIGQYQQSSDIIVSIDAKKKEYLGQLHRKGKIYCSSPIVCYDHDFPSQSTGKVNPFGVYDTKLNEGYLFLNQSVDTAEYAVDCLEQYLFNYGFNRYTNPQRMLVLCDAGGSNGCRNHRFKEKVQQLANDTGLQIRVAHYPSYCSKYNPCDHRLFPHITRALSGILLDSIDTIANLVRKRAKTKEGLKVFVRKINKVYKKGVKASKDFIDNSPIVYDKDRKQWNYMAYSQY